MIVYTSVYGGYDPLHPHPDHPAVDDWIAYTDDPELAHPDWTVIVEPPRRSHPRLSAKWRKCHPPECDATLWIDGSIWMHDPAMIDATLASLVMAPMTMVTHPWRDCIFEEVQASIGMLKYAGLEEAMRAQISYYAEQGHKAHAGLWASTVIGRDGSDAVRRMGAAWFAHCELFTYQDQLSLPPLLELYGIEPWPLHHSLSENPWFTWCGHNRND